MLGGKFIALNVYLGEEERSTISNIKFHCNNSQINQIKREKRNIINFRNKIWIFIIDHIDLKRIINECYEACYIYKLIT